MAKDRTLEMRESFAFGQRLTQILSERHIIQKQLAFAIGETEVTISRYMQGARTPKATVVLEIAKYLHVSMDYLYGYSACHDTYDDLANEILRQKPSFAFWQRLHLIKVLAE